MPAVMTLREEFSVAALRAPAKRANDANQSWPLLSLAAVRDGMNRDAAAKIGGIDRQTARPGSSLPPRGRRFTKTIDTIEFRRVADEAFARHQRSPAFDLERWGCGFRSTPTIRVFSERTRAWHRSIGPPPEQAATLVGAPAARGLRKPVDRGRFAAKRDAVWRMSV
jgi:hypothetical protein